MSTTDIIAAQSQASEPEDFQATLIDNLARSLLSDIRQPCLLRAPTGAGKTFIITRVLQEVSRQSPTLWFWFVPFANLMLQTEDSIAANSATLSPVQLARGRNQEPKSGMVVISTSAAVGRQASRKAEYTDGQTEDGRSIDQMVALAKATGLKIGLVVDEAHIGLDSQTEFGKFAKWLEADRVIMASATAKDPRLNTFVKESGFSALEAFEASRASVVEARLNKKYVEAVIYSVRQSMQSIADLQTTVLRQAWRRNMSLGKLLETQGLTFKPLLLVQVGSGPNAIEDARNGLMRHCGVHPSVIGEHSADDPDPVLMASIANDQTKEVLIFKQSAGTGFDAPRAFVLASMKPVNDPDFATQFLGRIMRVHRQIRAKYPRSIPVPEQLDTAYVYLANSEAQKGFEEAVRAAAGMRDELSGQTERLVTRETAAGGVHISNRTTDERPLFYDTPIPSPQPGAQQTPGATQTEENQGLAGVRIGANDDLPSGLFDDMGDPELDLPKATEKTKRKARTKPQNKAELIAALDELEVRAYPRRTDLPKTPKALMAEERPVMGDMASAAKAAATRLTITETQALQAVNLVLGKSIERELHTELTENKDRGSVNVAVLVNRTALAKEAREALARMPQVEDEDAAIIIDVLTKRLKPAVEAQFAHLPDDEQPDAKELTRLARDCAFVAIRKQADDLEELLHEEIAAQAHEVQAAALPDLMVFPSGIPLDKSEKNLFGVYPPTKSDLAKVPQVLGIEALDLMRPKVIELADGALSLADYDGSHALGEEERTFCEALDRAPFVVWWHRNPDRKPYSARLVRGEHRNYFYPDFIICLEHFPGDDPMARLVETKESTKDAARKAKHASKLYGRVLFLTKYNSSMRIVKQDGSLGDSVDFDDLLGVREWLRSSKPANASGLVMDANAAQ